jgi:glutaryl-CoA transferase
MCGYHSRAMAGPLSHIRVLDLSRILAAPWAGQVLADLGADVIKVERPGAGDDTRGWGPPFLPGGDAGYFLAVNRGKRSITLDFEKAAGRDIVRRLATRADVLLENYKAGTLERFGLGYAELEKINPRLVYCSVTGFGQTGPKREHAAYDFLIQAMGGLMSITGERDERPGGGPQKVGVPIVDLMTGMYAAVAVLAALAGREASGRGEYIDLAMLDVQVALLSNQAMNYLLSGKAPQRTGNAHPNVQPQDVFKCRDGAVVVVVGNDAQFVRFCEVLGHPEWARDERFAANAGRVRERETLTPMIAAALASLARQELIARLERAGVPCGPINSIAEVFAEPQVRSRGMRVDIGPVPQVASPLRFARAPLAYDRPPPRLGEHSDAILRELGMDQAEIEKLRADGVL